MGTVPTSPTFTAGAVLTAAQENQQRDVDNFLLNPPQCNAYRSAALSPATATWTAVGLDAEVFDIVQSGDSPGHDNATNNTRIFARTAGKYEVTGQVTFAANATGIRALSINLNAAGNVASGTVLISAQVNNLGTASTAVPAGVVQVYPMAAGDYVELFAYQSSGAGLALNTGLANTYLRIKWVGT